MKFFECCQICPSTKRHPGCHDKCPEYKEQKELFEKFKEAQRKELEVPPAKTDYLRSGVWHRNYKNCKCRKR